MTRAHCALNLPPNARSTPAEAAPATEQNAAAGSASEQQDKEAASEDVVDTEAEAGQAQPAAPAVKIITENGVVGSSELALGSFLSLLLVRCRRCFKDTVCFVVVRYIVLRVLSDDGVLMAGVALLQWRCIEIRM